MWSNFPVKILPTDVKLGTRQIGQDNGLDLIMTSLRILGNSPLTCNGEKYEFKWKKGGTLGALFMGGFFVFIMILFIFHIGLDIFIIPNLHVRYANDLIENGLRGDQSMNKEKLKAVMLSLKFSYILVPIFQILSIHWGWFNTKELALYLNTWPSISHEFSMAFPAPPLKDDQYLRHEKKTKEFKWKLALRTVGPVVVSIPIFLSGTITGSDASSVTSAIFYSVFFVHFAFVELLEDAKIILMCHKVADSFTKIRMSIVESVRWESLTEERVESWRLVICSVKSQGSLLSSYAKTGQLSFLMNIISTGTVLVYNGLTLPWGSPMGFRVSIMDTGFCLMMLWRLYAKADMAEHITEQEASIAHELMRMRISKYSSGVQAQVTKKLKNVKLIHDLIVQSETKIQLGSYILLTKRLFISIFTQIISYLIVLMTFIPTTAT